MLKNFSSSRTCHLTLPLQRNEIRLSEKRKGGEERRGRAPFTSLDNNEETRSTDVDVFLLGTDLRADNIAEAAAEGEHEIEGDERAGARGAHEEVADQRAGDRRVRGLAHTDQPARQQEQPEHLQ